MIRKVLPAWVLLALGSAAGTVSAQSTIGAGSTLLIPVVAQTGTYSSEVFLSNGSPSAPLTLGVMFIGANGSASPGQNDCGTIVLPPGGTFAAASQSFTLASQCGLGAGSHFGMIVLHQPTIGSTEAFFAYSRTQNFASIGFSVEGFPIGNVAAQSQRVIGLKRAAGPIPFQTNCFVGSFEKPVDYRIRLLETTGAQVGSSVDGSLLPFQMIRYLDIFSAAGLPSGDYSNVTALIQSINAQGPGNNDRPIYASFCTVQDNISFGADFRIGKSFDAWDLSYSKSLPGCAPSDGCVSYDYAITDVTKKDVFAMLVRPPDDVICELRSDRLADLEIQLRQPDIVPQPLTTYAPGSEAFPLSPGPVVAGGNNQTSFQHETGVDVMRVSDGALLRAFWSVEVSARELAPAPSVPIPYSISCRNGNGSIHARPYQATDDF